MSLYSRLDRLAADVEKLNRQVTAVANSPQSQRTSVEGGSIDFNDADGNLMAIMGGQDDGSNTIRHVDGPTPPIPSGLSAHVDGPIVQVSWDGTFESDVTHDWHYLEVLAVGPSNEQLTGTINDLSGGEMSLAATAQGDWFITARSVSRAGKRSLDGDAGTVAVQLVGLTGAIDAVQESANGKNTIYYSPTEPVAPDGGFNNGDLWFDTSEEGNNTASVWDGNGWVSMEDARLASIIAAQEALESDLQDVQTSVDGKNKITYDPALPPASYVGAVGDTWYRTSGNSMTGFWKWDGAAWIQQELSTTVIPQIDIGTGTFGSMSGTRLIAGSVSTDMLAVGVAGGLIYDSKFTNAAVSAVRVAGTTWEWTTHGGETCFERVMPASLSMGQMQLKDPVGSTRYIPVSPGVKQVLELDVEGGISTFIDILYADGSTLTPGDSIQERWSTGRRIERYVIEPDLYPSPTSNTATHISLYLRQRNRGSSNPAGAVTRVFSARLSPMVGATVIENGAITTDKLAVGSITAESGIIESLDLGTATVGELDGIRIMGQTVRGEQLSGDAIDGKVITGGTYRTSGGNGSWSDDGLFIAQPDGTSMVRFPTDGSPLSLTASDTQIERASIGELDVADGAIRSGGTMTLASGVTAPASPPELTAGWKLEAQLPRPAEPSMDWTGLAYWNGLYVRGVNVLTSAGDPYDRIELYNPDGTLNRSISIDINPRAGVAVIGDIVYTIGPDHVAANAGKQWCHGFNLNTGARVSRWEFTRFTATGQKQFTIGADGTNLLTAGVTPTPSLYVMKYDPATGEQIGGAPNPPSTGGDMIDAGWNLTARDLFGVHQDGNELHVMHKYGVRIYTVSGYAITRKPDTNSEDGWASWYAPNNNPGGFTFVGGVPYVVDSGVVYKGSTATADAVSEVCYTWWDGTHESTPSPVATVESKPRETVTVSLPIRTGLQKRLYSRPVGGGNWARSVIPENVSVFPRPTGFANYSPPTTNSFPNADPATLKSTNDKFEVKGDGSGHWGPLTFNADGTMSGIRKTASGTLDITPTAANTPRGVWVTFPAGRFTATPTVVVSARSSVPGTQVTGVGSGGQTAAGFYAYLTRTNTSTTGFNWIATEEG